MNTQEVNLGQFGVRRAGSQQPNKLFHFGILRRTIIEITFPNVEIRKLVFEVPPDHVEQVRGGRRLTLLSKLQR